MTPKQGQVYQIGAELMRCKTIRESGVHTFQLVDKDGFAWGQTRNSKGHVVCYGDRLITQARFEAEAVAVYD